MSVSKSGHYDACFMFEVEDKDVTICPASEDGIYITVDGEGGEFSKAEFLSAIEKFIADRI